MTKLVRLSVLIALITFSLAQKCPISQSSFPGCAIEPINPSPGQVSGIAAFEYEETSRNRPSRWANLDCTSRKFSIFRSCSYCRNTCGERNQSPINIAVSSSIITPERHPPNVSPRKSARFQYKVAPGNFELKCTRRNTCGHVKFQGKRYNLDNIHLHYFSEHQLNGIKHPLEMHMVHELGEENLVVSIFFRTGRFNKNLQSFIDIAKNRCVGDIRLRALASTAIRRNALVFYKGSLTTPPCTEGIKWFVSRQILQASRAQITTFLKLIGSSDASRPLQPINGRVLQRFE